MTAGNGVDLKKPKGKFVFDEIRDENPTKTRNSFGALVGALNGILIRRKNIGKIGKILFVYIKLLYHYNNRD